MKRLHSDLIGARSDIASTCILKRAWSVLDGMGVRPWAARRSPGGVRKASAPVVASWTEPEPRAAGGGGRNRRPQRRWHRRLRCCLRRETTTEAADTPAAPHGRMALSPTTTTTACMQPSEAAAVPGWFASKVNGWQPQGSKLHFRIQS